MTMVKITRIATDPNNGTFGVLVIDGEPVCVTLEPYSRDNVNNISNIPPGQYICYRYSSKKHPNTFVVANVQGRSGILFHTGNIDEDTEGCIILGKEYGKIGNNWAVLYSKPAFKIFMNKLKNIKQFKLTIVEEY